MTRNPPAGSSTGRQPTEREHPAVPTGGSRRATRPPWQPRTGSAAALPGPAGQLPGDEPYLDLAQYEQLIALGTADADSPGPPCR